MDEVIELTNAAVIGGELALVWSDGKETYLPFENLRRSCPCANCQGEPDALGRVVKPSSNYQPSSFTLRSYELMGGYALKLSWEDGHQTGIYSFTYLRKLTESWSKGD